MIVRLILQLTRMRGLAIWLSRMKSILFPCVLTEQQIFFPFSLILSICPIFEFIYKLQGFSKGNTFIKTKMYPETTSHFKVLSLSLKPFVLLDLCCWELQADSESLRNVHHSNKTFVTRPVTPTTEGHNTPLPWWGTGVSTSGKY